MIVQPLDALKDRLRETRLFSEEKLKAVCSGPKWEAAQDVPQGLRALVSAKSLTPWQAQMIYAGKTTLKFGNYVLLDRLSQDSQNRTFLAEHDSMGRRVALKQLSRQHTQNEKTSKKFLSKVRAFSAVNHPRLVHLFDVSQEHDRFYLVKELVEGENLAASIESQGPPPRERACRWIAEIAEGVEALHKSGIAHLDLHPGTVVAQKDGSIKILEPSIFEIGQEPGHAAFLAPEASGDDGSPEADFYSVGMLAHFVLTGEVRTADGAAAPIFEQEIATLTSTDPSVRKPAFAALVAAAGSMAEAADHEVMEAEEIVEAQPYEGDDPFADPWAEADPLAVPLGGGGNDDFFSNLDAAAAMATGAQPVLGPPPGTAAYAASGRPAPGGFPGIDLSADRTASPAASKEAPAPRRAEEEAPKKSNVGLLVGIAAGGGALAVLALVGVAALIYFLAFSADTTQIAQSGVGAGPAVTPTKATTPATQDADAGTSDATAGETTSKVAVPDAAPDEEPEEQVPDLGFSFGADPTATPAAPAADPPSGATPPAADPATAGAADPAAATAENPGAATPAPAPAEATPPTTPPADPPAATPPAATPPAAPANGGDAKPAPSGPTLANPFREVPPQVDLPVGIGPEPVTAPQTLAQVHLNAGDNFRVELEGGAEAVKGNKKFRIEPSRGGLLPNEWDILMDGSSALKDDNQIAHLKLEQTEFQFNWTKRAAQEPDTAYLKNASLALRTGTHAQILDLRKPMAMEPVLIEELEPVKITIPVSEVPDMQSLNLRILGLTVPFDYTVPNENLKATGDAVMIRLGRDGDVPAFIGVEVESRRNNVQIALTPMLQFSNFLRPEALKAGMAEKLKAQWTADIEAAKFANSQIAAFAAQYNKSPEPVKKQLKGQFDAYNAQKGPNQQAIDTLEKALKELEKGAPAIEKTALGATFHYKLTVGTGDDATVLAFTPPAKKEQVDAAAVAAEAKKE